MQNLVKCINYSFVIISISLAETYYISPGGSNANIGSIESPWSTLLYAQSKLIPGDTLYIRDGIYYNETIYKTQWVASGQANDRIVISGFPGENPVFDGNNETMVFFNDFSNISYITIKDIEIRNYTRYLISFTGNCDFWTFENLFIHDIGLASTSFVSGIVAGNCDNITIKNCKMIDLGTLTGSHHHIYMGKNCFNWKVYGNYLKNAASAGIHSYHTPGGGYHQIYNNIIKDCYWGIINGNGEQENHIYNNTLYNNTHPLDIRATDNIIVNNIVIGWTVEPRIYAGCTLDYNCWFPDWNGKGSNGITANPKFLVSNPQLIEDFRISSDSPCIDKGLFIDYLNFDFSYNKRPFGNGFDIGAFEFQEDNNISLPENLKIIH
jgi:hypothetical protein